MTAVKYSGDLVAPCVREYMVGRKNMCFVSVILYAFEKERPSAAVR